MKKLLLISVASVFVCAIISITVSSLTVGQNDEHLENTAYSYEENEAYVLKEYKGLVAVFKKGGELPVKITQTKVETLPPYDVEMLKEGIEAENEEKLEEMLMDYCS